MPKQIDALQFDADVNKFEEVSNSGDMLVLPNIDFARERYGSKFEKPEDFDNWYQGNRYALNTYAINKYDAEVKRHSVIPFEGGPSIPLSSFTGEDPGNYMIDDNPLDDYESAPIYRDKYDKIKPVLDMDRSLPTAPYEDPIYGKIYRQYDYSNAPKDKELLSLLGGPHMYSTYFESGTKAMWNSMIPTTISGLIGSPLEVIDDIYDAFVYGHDMPGKFENYGRAAQTFAKQVTMPLNLDERGSPWSNGKAATYNIVNGLGSVAQAILFSRLGGNVGMGIGKAAKFLGADVTASGIASKGSLYAGIGIGSLVMGDAFRQESARMGVSDTDSALLFPIIAAATALSESWFGPNIFSDAYTKSAANSAALKKIIKDSYQESINVFGKAAGSKLTKEEAGLLYKNIAKNVTEDAITKFRNKGASIATGFVEEGSEEFFEQVLQNGAEMAYDSYKKNSLKSEDEGGGGLYGVKSLTEGGFDSFVLGAISGGIAGGLMGNHRTNTMAGYWGVNQQQKVKDTAEFMHSKGLLSSTMHGIDGELLTIDANGVQAPSLNDVAYNALKQQFSVFDEISSKYNIKDENELQRIAGSDEKGTGITSELFIKAARIKDTENAIIKLRAEEAAEVDPEKKKLITENIDRIENGVDGDSLMAYDKKRIDYLLSGKEVNDRIVNAHLFDKQLLRQYGNNSAKTMRRWYSELNGYLNHLDEEVADNIKRLGLWTDTTNGLSIQQDTIAKLKALNPEDFNADAESYFNAIREKVMAFGADSVDTAGSVEAVDKFLSLFKEVQDPDAPAGFTMPTIKGKALNKNQKGSYDKLNAIKKQITNYDADYLANGLKSKTAITQQDRQEAINNWIFKEIDQSKQFTDNKGNITPITSYPDIRRIIEALEAEDANGTLADSENEAKLNSLLSNGGGRLLDLKAIQQMLSEGLVDLQPSLYFDQRDNDNLQLGELPINEASISSAKDVIDDLIKRAEVLQLNAEVQRQNRAVRQKKLFRNNILNTYYFLKKMSGNFNHSSVSVELQSKWHAQLMAFSALINIGKLSESMNDLVTLIPETSWPNIAEQLIKLADIAHQIFVEKGYPLKETLDKVMEDIYPGTGSYVGGFFDPFAEVNQNDFLEYNNIKTPPVQESDKECYKRYFISVIATIARMQPSFFAAKMLENLKVSTSEIPSHEQLRVINHLLGFYRGVKLNLFDKLLLRSTKKFNDNIIGVPGFAGTGKTSVVIKNIIDLVKQENAAAKILTVTPNTTIDGVLASTEVIKSLHKDFLQRIKDDQYDALEGVDLIIIDEAHALTTEQVADLERFAQAHPQTVIMNVYDSSQALNIKTSGLVDLSISVIGENTIPLNEIYRSGVTDIWKIQQYYRNKASQSKKTAVVPNTHWMNDPKTGRIGVRMSKNADDLISDFKSAIDANNLASADSFYLVFSDVDYNNITGAGKPLSAEQYKKNVRIIKPTETDFGVGGQSLAFIWVDGRGAANTVKNNVMLVGVSRGINYVHLLDADIPENTSSYGAVVPFNAESENRKENADALIAYLSGVVSRTGAVVTPPPATTTTSTTTEADIELRRIEALNLEIRKRSISGFRFGNEYDDYIEAVKSGLFTYDSLQKELDVINAKYNAELAALKKTTTPPPPPPPPPPGKTALTEQDVLRDFFRGKPSLVDPNYPINVDVFFGVTIDVPVTVNNIVVTKTFKIGQYRVTGLYKSGKMTYYKINDGTDDFYIDVARTTPIRPESAYDATRDVSTTSAKRYAEFSIMPVIGFNNPEANNDESKLPSNIFRLWLMDYVKHNNITDLAFYIVKKVGTYDNVIQLRLNEQAYKKAVEVFKKATNKDAIEAVSKISDYSKLNSIGVLTLPEMIENTLVGTEMLHKYVTLDMNKIASKAQYVADLTSALQVSKMSASDQALILKYQLAKYDLHQEARNTLGSNDEAFVDYYDAGANSPDLRGAGVRYETGKEQTFEELEKAHNAANKPKLRIGLVVQVKRETGPGVKAVVPVSYLHDASSVVYVDVNMPLADKAYIDSIKATTTKDRKDLLHGSFTDFLLYNYSLITTLDPTGKLVIKPIYEKYIQLSAQGIPVVIDYNGKIPLSISEINGLIEGFFKTSLTQLKNQQLHQSLITGKDKATHVPRGYTTNAVQITFPVIFPKIKTNKLAAPATPPAPILNSSGKLGTRPSYRGITTENSNESVISSTEALKQLADIFGSTIIYGDEDKGIIARVLFSNLLLHKTTGVEVYGVVESGMIKLRELMNGVSSKTPRHEAIHFIFEELLSEKEGLNLYDQARKLMGKPEATNEDAEEYIADLFMNKKSYKGVKGAIRKFIDWITATVNKWTSRKDYIHDLFYKMDTGGYAGESYSPTPSEYLDQDGNSLSKYRQPDKRGKSLGLSDDDEERIDYSDYSYLFKVFGNNLLFLNTIRKNVNEDLKSFTSYNRNPFYKAHGFLNGVKSLLKAYKEERASIKANPPASVTINGVLCSYDNIPEELIHHSDMPSELRTAFINTQLADHNIFYRFLKKTWPSVDFVSLSFYDLQDISDEYNEDPFSDESVQLTNTQVDPHKSISDFVVWMISSLNKTGQDGGLNGNVNMQLLNSKLTTAAMLIKNKAATRSDFHYLFGQELDKIIRSVSDDTNVTTNLRAVYQDIYEINKVIDDGFEIMATDVEPVSGRFSDNAQSYFDNIINSAKTPTDVVSVVEAFGQEVAEMSQYQFASSVTILPALEHLLKYFAGLNYGQLSDEAKLEARAQHHIIIDSFAKNLNDKQKKSYELLSAIKTHYGSLVDITYVRYETRRSKGGNRFSLVIPSSSTSEDIKNEFVSFIKSRFLGTIDNYNVNIRDNKKAALESGSKQRYIVGEKGIDRVNGDGTATEVIKFRRNKGVVDFVFHEDFIEGHKNKDSTQQIIEMLGFFGVNVNKPTIGAFLDNKKDVFIGLDKLYATSVPRDRLAEAISLMFISAKSMIHENPDGAVNLPHNPWKAIIEEQRNRLPFNTEIESYSKSEEADKVVRSNEKENDVAEEEEVVEREYGKVYNPTDFYWHLAMLAKAESFSRNHGYLKKYYNVMNKVLYTQIYTSPLHTVLGHNLDGDNAAEMAAKFWEENPPENHPMVMVYKETTKAGSGGVVTKADIERRKQAELNKLNNLKKGDKVIYLSNKANNEFNKTKKGDIDGLIKIFREDDYVFATVISVNGNEVVLDGDISIPPGGLWNIPTIKWFTENYYNAKIKAVEQSLKETGNLVPVIPLLNVDRAESFDKPASHHENKVTLKIERVAYIDGAEGLKGRKQAELSERDFAKTQIDAYIESVLLNEKRSKISGFSFWMPWHSISDKPQQDTIKWNTGNYAPLKLEKGKWVINKEWIIDNANNLFKYHANLRREGYKDWFKVLNILSPNSYSEKEITKHIADANKDPLKFTKLLKTSIDRAVKDRNGNVKEVNNIIRASLENNYHYSYKNGVIDVFTPGFLGLLTDHNGKIYDGSMYGVNKMNQYKAVKNTVQARYNFLMNTVYKSMLNDWNKYINSNSEYDPKHPNEFKTSIGSDKNTTETVGGNVNNIKVNSFLDSFAMLYHFTDNYLSSVIFGKPGEFKDIQDFFKRAQGPVASGTVVDNSNPYGIGKVMNVAAVDFDEIISLPQLRTISGDKYDELSDDKYNGVGFLNIFTHEFLKQSAGPGSTIISKQGMLKPVYHKMDLLTNRGLYLKYALWVPSASTYENGAFVRDLMQRQLDHDIDGFNYWFLWKNAYERNLDIKIIDPTHDAWQEAITEVADIIKSNYHTERLIDQIVDLTVIKQGITAVNDWKSGAGTNGDRLLTIPIDTNHLSFQLNAEKKTQDESMHVFSQIISEMAIQQNNTARHTAMTQNMASIVDNTIDKIKTRIKDIEKSKSVSPRNANMIFLRELGLDHSAASNDTGFLMALLADKNISTEIGFMKYQLIQYLINQVNSAIKPLFPGLRVNQMSGILDIYEDKNGNSIMLGDYLRLSPVQQEALGVDLSKRRDLEHYRFYNAAGAEVTDYAQKSTIVTIRPAEIVLPFTQLEKFGINSFNTLSDYTILPDGFNLNTIQVSSGTNTMGTRFIAWLTAQGPNFDIKQLNAYKALEHSKMIMLEELMMNKVALEDLTHRTDKQVKNILAINKRLAHLSPDIFEAIREKQSIKYSGVDDPIRIAELDSLIYNNNIFKLAVSDVVNWYNSFERTMITLAGRVPAPNSSSAFMNRVVGWSNDSANTGYIPTSNNILNNADQDIDQLSVYILDDDISGGQVNSVKQAKNNVLSLALDYYQDPKNLDLMMMPLQLKGLQDILDKQNKFVKAKTKSPYTATASFQSRNLAQQGKSSVSIFANTIKAYSMLYSSYLKDPSVFGSDFKMKKDGRDKDGGFIIEFLGKLVQAATDNAKLMILGQWGANKVSANVIAVLAIQGYTPEQVIAFMSDPSIKFFYKNILNGDVVDSIAPKKIKKIITWINNATEKYTELYNANRAIFEELSKDTNKVGSFYHVKVEEKKNDFAVVHTTRIDVTRDNDGKYYEVEHIIGSSNEVPDTEDALDDLDGDESSDTYVRNNQPYTGVEPEGTINVYWGQAESATSTKTLSNLAPRGFVYKGVSYRSVEHAYQVWKSGSIDEGIKNYYTSLFNGKSDADISRMSAGQLKYNRGKAANRATNLQLMKDLVVASFQQNANSEAAKKLLQYENFTHNTNEVIDNAFLEGLKLAQQSLLSTQSDPKFKEDAIKDTRISEKTEITDIEQFLNNVSPYPKGEGYSVPIQSARRVVAYLGESPGTSNITVTMPGLLNSLYKGDQLFRLAMAIGSNQGLKVFEFELDQYIKNTEFSAGMSLSDLNNDVRRYQGWRTMKNIFLKDEAKEEWIEEEENIRSSFNIAKILRSNAYYSSIMHAAEFLQDFMTSTWSNSHPKVVSVINGFFESINQDPITYKNQAFDVNTNLEKFNVSLFFDQKKRQPLFVDGIPYQLADPSQRNLFVKHVPQWFESWKDAYIANKKALGLPVEDVINQLIVIPKTDANYGSYVGLKADYDNTDMINNWRSDFNAINDPVFKDILYNYHLAQKGMNIKKGTMVQLFDNNLFYDYSSFLDEIHQSLAKDVPFVLRNGVSRTYEQLLSSVFLRTLAATQQSLIQSRKKALSVAGASNDFSGATKTNSMPLYYKYKRNFKSTRAVFSTVYEYDADKKIYYPIESMYSPGYNQYDPTSDNIVRISNNPEVADRDEVVGTIKFLTEEQLTTLDKVGYVDVPYILKARVLNGLNYANGKLVDVHKERSTISIQATDMSPKKLSVPIPGTVENRIGIRKASLLVNKLKKVFPFIKVKWYSSIDTNKMNVSSTTKGYIQDGVVYLNQDRMTTDTPMHEFGHIVALIIQKLNPTLYNSLMSQIGTTQADLIEKMRSIPEYRYLSDSDMSNEVFAYLLGLRSTEAMDTGVLNFPERMTLWEKIKGKISDVYHYLLSYISNALGFKTNSFIDKLIAKENFPVITLNELLNAIIKDVVDNNVLSFFNSKDLQDINQIKILSVGVMPITNANDLKNSLLNITEKQDEQLIVKEIANWLNSTAQADDDGMFHYTQQSGMREVIKLDASKLEEEIYEKIVKKLDLLDLKTNDGIVTWIKSTEATLSPVYSDFSNEIKERLEYNQFTDSIFQAGSEEFNSYCAKNGLDELANKFRGILKGRLPVIIFHGQDTNGFSGVREFSLIDVSNFSLGTNDETNVLNNYTEDVQATNLGIRTKLNKGSIYGINLGMIAMEIKKANPSIAPRNIQVLGRGKGGMTAITFPMIDLVGQMKSMGAVPSFINALPSEMQDYFKNADLLNPDHWDSNYLNALRNLYMNDLAKYKSDNPDEDFDSAFGSISTITGSINNLTAYENGKGSSEELLMMLERRLNQLRAIASTEKKDVKQNKEYNYIAHTIYQLRGLNSVGRNSVSKKLDKISLETKGMHNANNDVVQWIYREVVTGIRWILNAYNKWNIEHKNQVTKMMNTYNELRPDNMISSYLMDNAHLIFKRLIIFKNVADVDGNMHNVNTGMFHFDKNNPLTAVEIAAGRLKLSDLEYGVFMNEHIENMLISSFAQDNKIPISFKGDYKNSDNYIKAQISIGRSWTPGMLPLMRSSVTSKLFRNGVGAAAKGWLKDLTQSDAIFDFMGQDDSNNLEIADRFYQGFSPDVRNRMLGFKTDQISGNLILDNKKLNDDIDYNLERVMDYFTLSSIRKSKMNKDILPKVNAAKQILSAYNHNHITSEKPYHEKWLEFLDLMSERLVYGKRNNLSASVKLGGYTIPIQTVTLTAKTLTTWAGISFSIPLAINSFTANLMQLINNSFANGLTSKDLFNTADVGEAIAKTFDPKHLKVIMKIVDEFQLVNMDESTILHDPRFKKTDKFLFQTRWMYWMNYQTDYAARAVTAVAQMIHDGSFDAYSVNDKGELVYTKKKDKKMNGNSLREATIRKSLQENGFLNEGDELPYGYDWREIQALKTFSDKYIIGGVDSTTYRNIGYSVIGTMFVQFRSYLFDKIENLYATGYASETMGKYVKVATKDGEEEMIWQKEWIEGKLQSIVAAINATTKFGTLGLSAYENMTDSQRRNLVKLGTDLIIWSVLSIVVAGAMAGDDDKDKEDEGWFTNDAFTNVTKQGSGSIKRLISYTIDDLVSEFQLYHLMKNPLPVANFVGRLGTLIGALAVWDLEKAGNNFKKIVPGGASITFISDLFNTDKNTDNK